MHYVFIINVHGVETPYLVTAPTDDEAYQTLHLHLKSEQESVVKRQVWSDDWRDLKQDVERGEQTCYGPWDKIPHLFHLKGRE